MISSIDIQGNTLLPESALQPLLHSHQGKESSMEGLQSLAQQLTQTYHQAGYPLVSVIVPPQRIENGVVTLQVLEGKIGAVELNNQSRLADTTVHRYLQPIAHGQTLNQTDSERALLLLKDLAGTQEVNYRLSGGEQGSALAVDLSPAPAVDGFIQIDNYGSKSTGEIRTRVGANLNSPFGHGERFSVQAMSSFKGVNNARLGAEIPVGGQGLILSGGVAHTRYDLGGDFKDLNATGTANSIDVGARYPIMRSNDNNLWLNSSAEHRQLRDNIGATKTTTDKALSAVHVGLNGSHQDSTLAGGFTQWGVDGTFGHLNIKTASAKALDAASAKTQGNYLKLNAHLSRTQYLTPQWSLRAGLNGQWANKNLDSAEQFSLGGADNIAAYHSNDLSADIGIIGQLEVRYAVHPAVTLSAFYDAGWAQLKHTPYTLDKNRITPHGGGLGVYVQHKGFSLQSKVSWQADDAGGTREKKPRWWLKAGYSF